MMIKRIQLFLNKSILNKQILILPLFTAFILIFSFGLSIISLRMNVVEKSVHDLLIYQTVFLSIVGLITVAVITIVVILFSYLMCKPLCKLAQTTETLTNTTECKESFKPFTIRQDEVGYLAKKLSHAFTKITEQEKALAQKMKEQELGKIVSQVAHDVVSPLSTIKFGVASLQKKGAKPLRDSEFLALLELASQNLSDMVEDLLAKYKGRDIEDSVFSLHKILDELIAEFQAQDRYSKIGFERAYYQQSLLLYGRRTKLHRCFRNLIKNALEAMDGQGLLQVSTDMQGNSARIHVSDNGPGMDDDIAEQVVTGNHISRKSSGHGIGMKVVLETVDEFDGTIDIETSKGHGTTFAIRIPLPDDRLLDGAQCDDFYAQKLALSIPKTKPIVIIDDDKVMLQQWKMFLENSGFDTRLYESYEHYDASNASSGDGVSAIVDYNFDNSAFDGQSAIKELKIQGFGPIYLCTADYWKPHIQKIAHELDVTVIPKPLPQILLQ